MAILSINALEGGGGAGSRTVTGTSTGRTNINNNAEFKTNTPGEDGSSNIDESTPRNRLSSVNQFKEAADLINQNRKEAKLQIDELTNNLYSTLNQINFSIKLIVKSNDFLTKYTNDKKDILGDLTESLIIQNKETSLEISNNIKFNNLFISSIMFFENFSRLLMEAISSHLISGIIDPLNHSIKVEEIFNAYCEKFFIENNWKNFKKAYDMFFANYSDIFGITPLDLEDDLITLTTSQRTLITEYNLYLTVFNSLKTIFDPNIIFTLNDINENLIPSVKNIVNFKSGSTLYTKYLDKLDSIINNTIIFFTEVYDSVDRLISYNIEYQPKFEKDNIYISSIKEVAAISIDLLGSLKLKYPNRNSRKGLIMDESFIKVLDIINNLYRRELETSFQLINLASRDYKLIKSLETFVTTERSIDNSKLFKIMESFDNDLIDNNLNLFVRLYFDRQDDNVNVFGSDSFTQLLINNSIIMEPLYDILAYYRLFLFPFIKDTSLIFDFLETLYIYNKSLTKENVNETLNSLFDIKIANIDYINLNESKINESLTSRFEGLDQLNYFDIVPYINEIKNVDLSTITNISQLVNLFSNLKAYDLMLFAITENILYGELDLSLVMRTLSIKTNIRNIFFKLMFLIAIDKLITLINTYYSGDIPATLTIYEELNKNTNAISDFGEDLAYLKELILANDYYYGSGNIFNVKTIFDFNENEVTNIWDMEKIDEIIKLFSLYKEV